MTYIFKTVSKFRSRSSIKSDDLLNDAATPVDNISSEKLDNIQNQHNQNRYLLSSTTISASSSITHTPSVSPSYVPISSFDLSTLNGQNGFVINGNWSTSKLGYSIDIIDFLHKYFATGEERVFYDSVVFARGRECHNMIT